MLIGDPPLEATWPDDDASRRRTDRQIPIVALERGGG